MSVQDDLGTHTVGNQVPDLGDESWWALDHPLQAQCGRSASSHLLHLDHFGRTIGTANHRKMGELANRYSPELQTYDRFGHRIDTVEFHPSYHHLMSIAKDSGVHSIAWNQRQGHVAHTAMLYMLTQTEAGICCPLTMTYAGIPTLRKNDLLRNEWEPLVLSNTYDPQHKSYTRKSSLMLGMAMTEKQGGSDVRANQTSAKSLNKNEYLLTGHKWFCSAPMSDAFFTLAYTAKGLTCFFVPRFRFDGQKNRILIRRLKDKLGNRSNASSEIEFDDTWALRIGEEGRGVPTIIEMVHHTRLDCTTAAVGIMRQSLFQAVHHAQHRKAFGKKLINQPLMQHVLTDLALEWEASLAMVFRIAEAYDSSDLNQEVFARLAVAIGKYWTNKRCVPFVGEAMECLGGAGYVEESILPRLYREAPLNGIWEGSGNVICLDVLRTITKEPNSLEIFFTEIETSSGKDPRFDKRVQVVKTFVSNMSDPTESMWQARWLVENLALNIQGNQLLSHGDIAITEGFLTTRMTDVSSRAFGATTNLSSSHYHNILERVLPGCTQ